MRVWVIGAARAGTEAIRQLQKNDEIEIVVSDAAAEPLAVREGLIARVDHVESVTPININSLARRVRPDLIVIDSSGESQKYGRMSGGSELSQALTYEIAAASEFPCLVL